MLPSHARLRRPRLASVNDEAAASLYELPLTSSSLVPAAMADRRRREESSVNTIDGDIQVITDTIPDAKASKRNFTAADKFIR